MAMPIDAEPVPVTAEDAIEALKAAAFTERVDLGDVKGMPSQAEMLDMLRYAANMLRPDWYAHDEIEPFVDRVDAIPEPPEPRRLVHSFFGGFGADHDLEEAIELVERARLVVWAPSLVGHELAVEVRDEDRARAYHFDVRAPDHVAAAPRPQVASDR